MKKLILICGICLITGAVQAQELKENEIPSPVKQSFTKRFPNAKDVKWSKENAAEYEAEFKTNGAELSSNFDQTGKWLVTETEIKNSDLPQPVQSTIAKEFAGFKIEEAEKSETMDRGMFYEVELEKGEVNYEVQLSATGKVLKKEEKKEKDEKD